MKKKIFSIVLATIAMFAGLLSSAQVYTGINQWLITGSFTDQGNPNLHSKAFFDEPAVTPAAGEMAGKNQWKAIKLHVLDFTASGFSDVNNAVAYAFTYVYSSESQPATLLLGSDDGVMVWVNGLLVWDNAVKRGVTENEDKVEIQLFKGYNRLLIKVDQSDGGWSMVCNLVTGLPVEISSSRPPADELAKSQNLQFLGISVFYKENNAAITAKVKNFEKTNIGKTMVSLLDNKGLKLAEQSEKTIAAGSNASVSFVFPLKKAADILSQPGNHFMLSCGDETDTVSLPNSLALDLVMLTSKDKTISDPETQKITRQIELAKESYASQYDLSSFAQKGLHYLAEGKNDSVKTTMHDMLDAMIENTPDLSSDTIHIIGHAHMDMNWLWPYAETKKMMHDNFRQVVAFMEAFPDYTMLQSQVSIYKYIEQVDPPLFDKVKKYVAEGRFEPVGGMWTEGDGNLSGGEAICRSFLLGQRYLYDHFGKTAHVGWLPDNFGHISQLPQLLRLAGCSYYYFMRCNPYAGTFWWTGPDSSKILCFSGNSYNNSVTPDINDIDRLSPQAHRIFVPTGVGDHGGGPTLNDINMAHRLDSTFHFPAVKFTTAEQFFKASSLEMEGRPTHAGEMQFIFEGCYTSVAEIKENTRKSEQSLYKTEFMSVLRWLSGENYPAADLKALWETVTFNQFHDILPGSAIYETYQDAVADHKEVRKKSNDLFETGFRHLADEIKFRTGRGQPVVAVNMHPYGKKVLVEAEIFTNEEPVTASLSPWSDYYFYNNVKPKSGPTATVLVTDGNGKTYPAQITGGKMFPPGFRSTVLFVADNMPPGGYKTFYIDASRPGTSVAEIPEKDGTFETDFFVVSFDMKTGDIVRLKDKRTGKEVVSAGGRLNKLEMFMEAPNGMNAWVIGEIKEIQDIANVESVTITERGPVRATVEAVKKWGNSKFIQRTYIYRSYPRIDFDLDAHWFETGDGIRNAPFLRTVFDLDMDNPVFDNHVPFDVVRRPTNGQEVPAQQWVDVTDGKTGIALLNRTKFGHSYEKGQLKLSLLRATYSPDIYPNIGVNHIQYSLFPHAGNWTNGVWEEADNYNVPVYAAEPPSLSLVKTHATRPEEDSLLIVSPSSVVMSGIKQGEDGKNLVIRLAEVNGKETTASITLPVAVRDARRVNIIEFPQEEGKKPVVNGKNVEVTLRPHEIVTLSVKISD